MRNFENKEKIAQVSRVFEFLCGACVLFWGFLGIESAYAVFSWFLNAAFYSASARPNLNAWFWYGTLATGIEVLVWWNLYRFFGRLAGGCLFDRLTVQRLAVAGKLKLASWGFAWVPFLVATVRTGFYWPGKSWMGMGEMGGLTGAVAILFMAWLLREGQSLQEEQELTV